MAWIHVHHRVQDYNQWKAVYDKTAEYKRHEGWKRYRIYQVAGDRNDLIVMEQFSTLEQAQAYVSSDYLHQAMDQAGVVPPVEVLIVEGLDEGVA